MPFFDTIKKGHDDFHIKAYGRVEGSRPLRMVYGAGDRQDSTTIDAGVFERANGSIKCLFVLTSGDVVLNLEYT